MNGYISLHFSLSSSSVDFLSFGFFKHYQSNSKQSATRVGVSGLYSLNKLTGNVHGVLGLSCFYVKNFLSGLGTQFFILEIEKFSPILFD